MQKTRILDWNCREIDLFSLFTITHQRIQRRFCVYWRDTASRHNKGITRLKEHFLVEDSLNITLVVFCSYSLKHDINSHHVVKVDRYQISVNKITSNFRYMCCGNTMTRDQIASFTKWTDNHKILRSKNLIF